MLVAMNALSLGRVDETEDGGGGGKVYGEQKRSAPPPPKPALWVPTADDPYSRLPLPPGIGWGHTIDILHRGSADEMSADDGNGDADHWFVVSPPGFHTLEFLTPRVCVRAHSSRRWSVAAIVKVVGDDLHVRGENGLRTQAPIRG
jgi:hypothetical protein